MNAASVLAQDNRTGLVLTVFAVFVVGVVLMSLLDASEKEDRKSVV